MIVLSSSLLTRRSSSRLLAIRSRVVVVHHRHLQKSSILSSALLRTPAPASSRSSNSNSIGKNTRKASSALGRKRISPRSIGRGYPYTTNHNIINNDTTNDNMANPDPNMNNIVYEFDEVAMLPQVGDSAAVAKRLLSKGSQVRIPADSSSNNSTAAIITMNAPCLEGHRFVIVPVAEGQPLLSWGLPFGHASSSIVPGDCLMNAKAATALQARLTGPHEEAGAIRDLLATQPVNFVDLDVSPESPFIIEENGGYNAVGLNHCQQQQQESRAATFMGYPRPHGRGVGTRNHVVVIALTASAAPFLVKYKNRWQHYEEDNGDATDNNFDGVRVVAHTEGESTQEQQHNIDHIHRCIAGFLIHMNVGGAIIVTTGQERHVTPSSLMAFFHDWNKNAMNSKKRKSDGTTTTTHDMSYPLECFAAPFTEFVQIQSNHGNAMLQQLDDAVEAAVTRARQEARRQPCPLSQLRIALQCGGSDSFSGLTGNPLAGDVVERLIHEHGGSAVLAESPELVGAEPYILSRVASEATARHFIRTTEAYKAYGARHGLSVAGNPSGGNLYRGLYNIVLKSLGAARKKAPSITLDCVLAYGEPMPRLRDASEETEDQNVPHYAFMDSPGNDLESIAGQVASGSNLIIFITGNGAMTNFPFVPTIKVVTTAKRYELLKHEMDINAGPYGHGGTDRQAAVDDGFDLCVRVASGERSKGEKARHSQVSVWRNWAIGEDEKKDEDTSDFDLMRDAAIAKTGTSDNNSGGDHLFSRHEPHEVRPDLPPLPKSLLEEKPVRRVARPQNGTDSSTPSSPRLPLRPWASGASLALIPTSLCSSAVASTIKDNLIKKYGLDDDSTYIVCPSHTEGCGAAGDMTYERRYQRIMLGHVLHPSIGRAIFLEHGCEKTHNDYFRNCLRDAGIGGVDEDSLSSLFHFWSLQGNGGFDNAQKEVTDYFFESPCDEPNATALSESWCSRPISVGLLIDRNSVPSSSDTTGHRSTMLASSLASIIRFLAMTNVNTVLPVNSPLITGEIVKPSPAANTPSVQQQRPTATNDMEDFFAPQSKAKSSPTVATTATEPLDVQFVAETLSDATIPNPTLLPGQMIKAQPQQTSGLHVMDLPKGATWDETVSCLSPACDMMLLVAGADNMAVLPGSCLSPTLRRVTPTDRNISDKNDESSDSSAWQEWTADTCTRLLHVLRSPLVAGGDDMDVDELAKLRKSLFSMTTFVVPRGHAVSF